MIFRASKLLAANLFHFGLPECRTTHACYTRRHINILFNFLPMLTMSHFTCHNVELWLFLFFLFSVSFVLLACMDRIATLCVALYFFRWAFSRNGSSSFFMKSRIRNTMARQWNKWILCKVASWVFYFFLCCLMHILQHFTTNSFWGAW